MTGSVPVRSDSSELTVNKSESFHFPRLWLALSKPVLTW